MTEPLDFTSPIHVRLLGDAVEAGKYIGPARQRLRHLVAFTKVQGKKVEQMAESVRVTYHIDRLVRKYGVDIDASSSACSNYLESGWMLYGSYDVLVSESYEPARIKLGPQTSQPWGKLDKAFVTHTEFSSGQMSPGAYFYKPVYKALDVIPAGTVIGVTGDRSNPTYVTQAETDIVTPDLIGTYPISQGLLDKKISTGACPSSVYSGKMRLLVQAKWGGGFADPQGGAIAAQTDVTTGVPYVTVNDVSIGPYSDGLYSDADGSFWIVSLSTHMRVTQVKLTECGKSIMRHIKSAGITDRKAKAKLEAYALAGATLDTSMSFTTEFSVPNLSPVAYGWKWNWAGNEASMIYMMGHGGGNDTYRTSFRAIVSISRNADLDVSGFSTPVEAEKARWYMGWSTTASGSFNFPWGNLFLWTPFWRDRAYVRSSGLNQFETPYYGSGAVYGWYDDTDNFVTVSITHGQTSSGTTTNHANWPPGLVTWAGMHSTYNYFSGTTEIHEVSVGGDTYAITTTSGEKRTGYWTVSNPGLSVPADTFTPPTGPAVEGNWNGSGFSWANSYRRSNHPGFDTGDDEANAALWANMDAAEDAFTCGTAFLTGSWLNTNGYIKYCRYERDTITSTNTVNMNAAIVIPFYDSEAAYVFTQRSESDVPTARGYGVGVSQGDAGGDYINCYHRETLAGLDQFSCAGYGYAGNNANPVTSTTLTPATTSYTALGYCHTKSDVLAATTNNIYWLLYSGISNDETASKACYTFTSAVYNYSTGTDLVAPSHPDFVYGTGAFIGWF